MRVSLTQSAAGALTILVAGGLSVLPGRLLGPEAAVRAPIDLPAASPLPAVVAAPAPAPTRHRVVHHVVVRTAARPAQLASVVTHPALAHHAARVVHHRATPHASGVLAVWTIGHARHLPLPADTARPASPPPPPAPAAPPAATPAVVPAPAAPAPPTTTVRVLADTYVPAATSDENEDGQGEDEGNGNDHGNGHAYGHENGNGKVNGNGHGWGRDK